MNPIRWEDIQLFVLRPEVFGHYLGYNDLIDIHGTWIKNAYVNKNKLAMQAHRNSYKTTSILIIGAIWYLLFFNQNATILFIRKKDTDAQRIIETIRQHLESNEIKVISDFLYNTPELKTETWSKTSLKLSIKQSKTPEGNIDAKGTTTAITGAHYDFIFPDDIISLKDRVSKAEREWIKNFVRELKNIIKKPDGKIFYSGTPWHKDDAWSILPEPDLYPVGTIDIPGFRKNEIEKTISELRRGNTESLIAANYFLKHITDEKRLFPEPVFADWHEKSKMVIAYLDPAYKGDNTTALSIASKDINDNIVIDGFVYNKPVTDLYSTIVNILNNRKCGTLYVESNADKGLSAIELRKIYPAVIDVNEKENKHIRILNYVRSNWHKITFDKNIQIEYINQILDYQEGQEPDDAPDSLAGLCRELRIGKNNLLQRYG